ncbi:MAG: hypothetical protein ACLQUY_16095 [Ktedonobacterales bacterium]
MVTRTPLLRQPALYIGLVSGIIMTVLIGLLATLFLSSHAGVYKPSTALPSAGNITITLDQNAMDLAMHRAVEQVQPQLPFTITGESTTLRPGDEIDVYLAGQPDFGITPTLLVTLSPAVAQGGTLDFHVQQVTFTGLNVSLGGAVNQAIEQAINQQFSGYGRGNLVSGLHYQLLDVSTTSKALIITAQLTAN